MRERREGEGWTCLVDRFWRNDKYQDLIFLHFLESRQGNILRIFPLERNVEPFKTLENLSKPGVHEGLCVWVHQIPAIGLFQPCDYDGWMLRIDPSLYPGWIWVETVRSLPIACLNIKVVKVLRQCLGIDVSKNSLSSGPGYPDQNRRERFFKTQSFGNSGLRTYRDLAMTPGIMEATRGTMRTLLIGYLKKNKT